MDIKDYLGFTLGKKYDLNKDEICLLALILTDLRAREFDIRIAGAPLLYAFDPLVEGERYSMIATSRQYYNLVAMLAVVTEENLRDAFNMLITERSSSQPFKRVAVVFLQEWQQTIKMVEMVAEPVRQLEAAEETSAYEGWIATGKYEVSSPTGDGQEPVLKSYNLAEKIDDAPGVVQLARLVHACWDAKSGTIDLGRLEGVTVLMAQLFQGERNHFAEKMTELQKAARPEPVSIWPKNKEHWVFDPIWSAPRVAWPVSGEYPVREELEEIIRNAAKFAVSRASGMGTTRGLNIEGFVDNTVIGLIGDGRDGATFDFRKLFFQKVLERSFAPTVAEPATPAVVAEPEPAAGGTELQRKAAAAQDFQRPEVLPVEERGAPATTDLIKDLQDRPAPVYEEVRQPAKSADTGTTDAQAPVGDEPVLDNLPADEADLVKD